MWWLLIMRNKSTVFYSKSQVKVLNKIYWQKGPVAFILCKSLENSTGHRPGDRSTAEHCLGVKNHPLQLVKLVWTKPQMLNG